MKKYLILLCSLLSLGTCLAQQVIIHEVLPPPAIRVTNLQEGETPVRLSEVNIDVKVIGPMAVTTVDMIFYNPNNRILEGEFQFPLGEGQNISRFALDINGKLREGVAVEKAKGQAVFESVIRQNIDPGLLEKTQGNNFRSRIYPLPGKGTRRIVIAYEQELQKDKDGCQVFLPIEYGEILDKFNVNVLVVGNDVKPKVNQSPWGKFSFQKANEAFVASYSAEDYLAKGQLVFSIPQKKNEQVFVEDGKISGETVFFSQIYPKIEFQAKVKSSTIALFWDVSMSMTDRQLEMELELLKNYLTTIGNVKIELHAFNCLPMPVKSFAIKNGSSGELLEYLHAMPYDGATQLGILDFKNLKADEVLLLSDGLSNFGKSMPLVGTIPVNAISSSLKADHSLLQYLAATTGGKYINLMQQQVADVVPLLLQNSYRLISAEYNKADIKSFTTSTGLITETTGFSFAGKLKGSKASVTLNFGIGTKVLYSETVVIEASQKGDYDNIVERIWAQKKIGELDLLYENHKDEIEHLGRSYNIVTRNTSLIVLDRVQDYFEHKITPPAELLDEYNSMLERESKEKYDVAQRQVDRVVSMFEKRKEWWKRDYPKGKPLPPKKISSGFNSDSIPFPPYDPNAIISMADVVGDDEEYGVDVAELEEHVVIVEDAEEGYGIDFAELQELVVVGLEESRVIVEERRKVSDVSDELNSIRAELMDEMNQMVDLQPEIDRMRAQLGEKNESADSDSRSDQLREEIAKLEKKNMELKLKERARSQRLAKVALKNWDSNTPYLTVLKAKSDKELYDAYIEIRKEYISSPSFYLDVATLFEERGLKQEALIILSNLAEIEVENYRLLRVLAHRLQQLGYLDYAINQFERVLKLRPEEPQTYRDLASVYEQNKQFQESVDMLYSIIEKRWDGRFSEIELFAAEEMNRVIYKAERSKVNLSLVEVDERLIFNMPVDVRIVLNWDTDNSDMDLWVTDPYGEKCFYSNKQTRIGGLMSADLRGGYGPEEYLIREAVNGAYKIQANYYSSGQQTLLGPTTVYLDIYTRYADQREKKETITLRLTERKDTVDIGEVTFSDK